MSSALVHQAATTLLSRHVSRGLTRLEDHALLGRAQIEAVASIQAAKADALGAVAGRALQDVALLSQMEQQLAQTVPLASGRLAAIADVAAISLTSVVTDTACRLRRC